MKQLTDLELLKLNKGQLFVYKLKKFFCAIPAWFKKTGIKIGKFFKNLGISIYIFFRDLVMTFVKGDWKTRVSYVILGCGSLALIRVAEVSTCADHIGNLLCQLAQNSS